MSALVAEGTEQLAGGDDERAAAVLRERSRCGAGHRSPTSRRAASRPAVITRLDEQRLAALEARIDADLALRTHAELVGELQELAAAHPARERLHGQLMLALYRGGRQADALDAYRRARATWPTSWVSSRETELRTLQADILGQSPSLDPPRERRPACRPRRAARPR